MEEVVVEESKEEKGEIYKEKDGEKEKTEKLDKWGWSR